MSHKASLACAGAFAAVAAIAGMSPAFSHTIVGNRVFPATNLIDDPGENDELAVPTFAYMANPDNSNLYSYNFEYAKTITAELAFSIGNTYNHLTNTVKPDGTIGSLSGWSNIETQLKYGVYQNAEHEFIISVAGSVEWGHTGNVGVGFADPESSITAKGYFGKGFGDAEAEWVRPFALTGEMDYTWSTQPTSFGFNADGSTFFNQNPTVLTYGATIQYSLLYMNSFVHEVPPFLRQLIPTFECVFSSPVSNIGPSSPLTVPGTHQTTGTFGPGVYYFGRLGPVTYQLGATMEIPINYASGRHVGAIVILDFLLDDMFPDSIGKPLFGPRQARGSTLY